MRKLVLALALFSTPALAAGDILMHRDPGCGCCEQWAARVRQTFGRNVRIVDDANRTAFQLRTCAAYWRAARKVFVGLQLRECPSDRRAWRCRVFARNGITSLPSGPRAPAYTRSISRRIRCERLHI